MTQLMTLIRAKTQKVYDLYKPFGLASKDVSCWRCGFMADRLIDLLTYEGIQAERCNILVQRQGHVCVKVTAGDVTITADPSVEQFKGYAGIICVEGAHPAVQEVA